MLEHDVDHLGEVVGQQARDLVGFHRLRHRREAADIREEHDDRPLGPAERDFPLLLRDLRREVGREIALEVRHDHGLAAQAVR